MLPLEISAYWNIDDAVLNEALGQGLTKIEPLGGGGNNKVFKVTLKDGTLRALKLYFQHPNDPRNRLKAEYDALSFLWNQGIRTIPEPLGSNSEHHFAIYSFVDGTTKLPEALEESDLEQAISFARKLKQLSQAPEARALGIASEACFSLKELWQIIDSRFGLLMAARSNPAQAELDDFLSRELEPFISQVRTFGQRSKFQKLSYLTEITRNMRTLSPSDFGFHNALLNLQGTWIFQDFEYFGWDDPSKLLADFILHPAMHLSENLQRFVVQRGLECFESDQELAHRLELVYPIYGIKWCLIILNEFIPEFRARRVFSGSISEAQLFQKQIEQRNKAQALLGRVRATYEKFPRQFGIDS